MTINNTQEQTLNHAEIYIHPRIFLPMANSMWHPTPSSFDNIAVAAIEGRRQCIENDSLVTSDSVYREVL